MVEKILNCTQNLGHKIGGVVFFVSKLTREDKKMCIRNKYYFN